MDMDIDSYKYNKYKFKYINYKTQHGGGKPNRLKAIVVDAMNRKDEIDCMIDVFDMQSQTFITENMLKIYSTMESTKTNTSSKTRRKYK